MAIVNDSLRNMSKMSWRNDGSRSLMESTMVPEIAVALKSWRYAGVDAVLIGGVAMSYYGKPRYTDDADFLFLSESAIPTDVFDFKRTRAHAFVHRQTQVEIEVLSAEYLSIPQELAQAVIERALPADGLKVASPSGLVALKLFRLTPMDRADIIDLILNQDIDLTGFGLPQDKIAKFVVLMQDAEEERGRPKLGD